MGTDSRWVGAILRQTRELAGVSREQMAEACRVSPGAVSHWEGGRTIPNAAQIGVWARVTGVPVEVLFRETGLMDEPDGDPPSNVSTLRDWWRARRTNANGQRTDRLHSQLRRSAHNQPARRDNQPNDPDGPALSHSQGFQSPAHQTRRAG